MKYKLPVIIIVLLTIIGCKKDKIEGSVQTNATLADSLKLSPAGVLINNDSLLLTTYLWRDFMPQQDEKGGSNLYCSTTLHFKDSLPILEGITFKNVYVLKGDQIWSNHLTTDFTTSTVINGVLRNGPKWGPNIFVDVVCEFAIKNTVYRIVAKQQKIDATY